MSTKYLIRKILSFHVINGVTLNINIPDIPFKDIKGIKVCRQGKGKWVEKINLEDGINNTIEWIDDNYLELSNLKWTYTHKE